ncbi:MAG: transporter substrate-binding domain-containing protein, partial [Bacteroidetes bacterium]|nr:transporter substrate-binding domain-containing protein [Bacteroidota bacterium]
MKTQTKPAMGLQSRKFRTLMLFLVFAGFAFQFHLSPAIAERSPDEILVGVHKNFPPQYSIDEKTGKPTGFAIDIMDEVASRAGLKIRYVIFDEWPQLTQALKEGQIDIIPNNGIIEERKADMDFTNPVEAFNISIFVRETTTDIHGIDDLQGRKVAVVKDNKGLLLIQEYGRAEPLIFNSLDEALLSLLSGNTDALVYPEPPVLLIAIKSKFSKRIKTVGKPLLEVKRAIAVGKGKPELFNKLDKEVNAFVDTPEYAKIYVKWYGAPEPYWNARRVLILAGSVLALVIVIFAVWHYLSLMRVNRDLKYSIMEQKKAEGALRLSEERFRHIFDEGPFGMNLTNPDHTIAMVNKAFCELLGYTEQELAGQSIADITYEEDREKSREFAGQLFAGSIPMFRLEKGYVRKDGAIVWANITASAIHGKEGNVLYALVIVQDLTESKKAAEKIHLLHYYDSLTGLPNRTFHKELIKRSIEHAHRHKEKFAIIYIGLDNFQRINDTLGYSIGDLLLKAVADKLTNSLRESDYVARSDEGETVDVVSRVGGDEFIVLAHDLNQAQDAAIASRRLLKEISAP